ncbi:hypothetical protein M011DRAFT_503171 [Sporormia fimetaria CBS 119925]|uniref:TPR-like protein n=1 Tax=Sporormia fimetaria CBS 119925 TaxID=1340428 RepID=A0A6A6VMW1_9PLEO|nr:hypothetical protein M011DRAFT_503171 [Sporormia fimetaria CBS 119925]
MPILPRISGTFAYLALGSLAEAEDMVLPCVQWIESSKVQWEFNAKRTGGALYALGNLRLAQGREDDGYALHERALTHYRSTLGKTHFYTAKASMKMSEYCVRRLEYSEALQHIENALEAWSNRKIFEGYRARASYRKARVFDFMDNKLKAKGLFLKAEKMRLSWLKAFRPFYEPKGPEDYDALVPCYVR